MLPAKRVPFCALPLLFSRQEWTHSKDTSLLSPVPLSRGDRRQAQAGGGSVCGGGGGGGPQTGLYHPAEDCTFQLDPTRGLLLPSLSLMTMVAPAGGRVTPLACSFSLGFLNSHVGDTLARAQELFKTRSRSIGDKAQNLPSDRIVDDSLKQRWPAFLPGHTAGLHFPESPVLGGGHVTGFWPIACDVCCFLLTPAPQSSSRFLSLLSSTCQMQRREPAEASEALGDGRATAGRSLGP